MAIVPDKSGNTRTDVHVYKPSEIASGKVAASIKLPAGAVASGKPPVAAP